MCILRQALLQVRIIRGHLHSTDTEMLQVRDTGRACRRVRPRCRMVPSSVMPSQPKNSSMLAALTRIDAMAGRVRTRIDIVRAPTKFVAGPGCR
jgi:hypothetical protein